MQRLILFVFIGLALLPAPAMAQVDVRDQLIGPDSFPDLELQEDDAINLDDPDGDSDTEELGGWGRLWLDATGTGGVVAMATALDAESAEAFLAGFQSTVPREDRRPHGIHANVVVQEAENPDGGATLAAGFADGTVAYLLITEGPDREELLDRAIDLQLTMIEGTLIAQSPDLAEEFTPPRNDEFDLVEFIGRAFLASLAAGVAAWFILRSRRTRSE